jgi:O-methyltransferase
MQEGEHGYVTLISEQVMLALSLCAAETPKGCFVEVGVFQGGSARYLATVAEYQNRELYLYDTFEGMPYQSEYDKHPVGDFSDTSEELVRKAIPSATIVKGVFPDSAVEMPPIAFAHIDCDQYQAVRDSALYLIPRMTDGGIIWFDDADILEGANRAVNELFPVVSLIEGKAVVRINK